MAQDFSWLYMLEALNAGVFGSDPAQKQAIMARIQQQAGPNWQAAMQAGYITPEGQLTPSAPKLQGAGPNQQYAPVNSGMRVNPYTQQPVGADPSKPVVNDPIFGQTQAIESRAASPWYLKYGPALALLPGMLGGALAGGFGAGLGGGFGEGLSAADAYAAFAGGEAATPFHSLAGLGAEAAGGLGGSAADAYVGAHGGAASTPFTSLAGGGAAAGGAAAAPAGGGFSLPGGLTWSDIARGGGAAASLVNGALGARAIGAATDKQNAANTATAIQQSTLNNPNINTPYGSQQVVYDPATGRNTITQTLSPEQQAILEQEQRNTLQSGQIAGNLATQLGSSLGQPFGLPGAPDRVDMTKFGPIQSGLDFSKAPKIPNASAATRDAVALAFFNQGAGLLDPKFKNLQSDLDAMLSAQGIARNPGEAGAWQREQDALALQREQAYNDLAQRATVAGGDAMAQLFGMGLQAHETGVRDITTQGQFANTAQNQGVSQYLAGTGANNAARGQQYNEYVTNRQAPLNMYNAFRTGGQVTNPQFAAPVPTSIQPTNYQLPALAQQGAIQGGITNAANLLAGWLPKPGG